MQQHTRVHRLAYLAAVTLLVTVLAVGYGLEGIPQVAALCVATLVLIVILGHPLKLQILCLGMAFFAMLPLPNFIPSSISIAGGTLFVADVIACLVFVIVFARISILSSTLRLGIMTAVIVVSGAAVSGLLRGASLFDIVSDARGLAYMTATALGLAISLLDTPQQSKQIFVHASSFMVIYSAVAVATELVLSVDFFAIRSNAAVLYTASGNSTSEAVRLIPTSGLFCVVLAGVVIGLWVTGGITSKKYPMMLPVAVGGLFIGFQGFSRNNLVALLLAMSVCILIRLRLRTILRFVGGVMGVVLLSVFAWRSLSHINQSLFNMGQKSIDAFQQRVLVGLQPGTVSEDYSSQWRLRESAAGMDSIQSSPMGTGLGVAYRGWLPGDPFSSDYGYTYIHNSYLWLPVKVGLVGTFVIALLIIFLIISLLRRKNDIDTMAFSMIAAAGAALAAVMFVSPLPFSRGDGVLCGAVFGLCLWLVAQNEMSKNLPSARFLHRSRI